MVQAETDSINVRMGEESWAGSAAPAILDDPELLDAEADARLLETVTRSTLSGVQDAISRARAEPWPVVAGDASAMPGPNARVADGVLHAWFGDEDSPALRLEPIPLAALGL